MTKENSSALHSRYVIDGIRMELTPAQMLDAVCESDTCGDYGNAPDALQIIDESIDGGLNPFKFDRRRVKDYLQMVLDTRRQVPMAFADTYTRSRIAASLIDCLWRQGRFKLGDIALSLSWKWNGEPLGNMAAFYSSARAAADYLDSLGVTLSGYDFAPSRDSSLSVKASLLPAQQDEFLEGPYRSSDPSMRTARSVGSLLVPDPQSWIVYIPFETADYRFGGSLLSQALGRNGGVSLQIEDADYFIDCFEVLRELVEDKILLSAATVADGGLLAAVKRMTEGGTGAVIDVSDVMKSANQEDVVRVLFAEVPGVIVQIRDIDFDYLDAELLLQDVVFFPLGHPCCTNSDVRVRASEKSGIQTILESLIQNQCGEGED